MRDKRPVKHLEKTHKMQVPIRKNSKNLKEESKPAYRGMKKDQTNFFDEISLVSNDVKVEAAMYSYSVLLKFMCQFCAVFRFLLDLNRVPPF